MIAKPAYTRSEYFHFSVKYKGHPLYLRLLSVEEGLVHIEEVTKQKWEEFLWQGQLFRGDEGRWEWTEEDNFFAEYGGKGLADCIAAYVNENGVPKAEGVKVASVPDDLRELWVRLRQLTDEPEAVRKLWLLAQQEAGAMPPHAHST